MYATNYTWLLGAEITEDCLYAMVYVSAEVKKNFDANGKKAPVVVIFYGGAFVMGSAGMSLNDGRVLSAQDIVVVAINYRLGFFGFMDHNNENVPGNMGLMDQQQALKWIHKYIQYFGGDAESVTLLGVSAGSISIGSQVANDNSRKLFKNAIMDGGSISSRWVVDHYMYQTAQNIMLATYTGCFGVFTLGQAYRCLMTKTSKQILMAQDALCNMGVSPLFLTYGSTFFPEDPKKALTKIDDNIPTVVIGTAKLEGSMLLDVLNPNIYPPKKMSMMEAHIRINVLVTAFRLQPQGFTTPYAALHEQGVIDVVTDGMFTCGVLEFADKLSQNGASVYIYQMNYFSKVSPYGLKPHAHHGMGFNFFLGLPLSVLADGCTDNDKEVARKMVDVVNHVANNSRALSFGLTPLKRYSASNRRVNIFSEEGSLRIQEGHDRDEMCSKVWGYKISS